MKPPKYSTKGTWLYHLWYTHMMEYWSRKGFSLQRFRSLGSFFLATLLKIYSLIRKEKKSLAWCQPLFMSTQRKMKAKSASTGPSLLLVKLDRIYRHLGNVQDFKSHRTFSKEYRDNWLVIWKRSECGSLRYSYVRRNSRRIKDETVEVLEKNTRT